MGSVISKKRDDESSLTKKRKFSNTVTSNISSLFPHRGSEEKVNELSGKIVIRSARNKRDSPVSQHGDDQTLRPSSIGYHPRLLSNHVDYGHTEHDNNDDDDDEDDDDDFPRFLPSHSSSMSRAMTPSLWKQLRSGRTSRGFDINDCVQAGVDVPRHRFVTSAGCVAPDADAYHVFGEFFEKVIAEQHRIYGGFDPNARVYNFPTTPTILRFAIKSRRNVSSFAFPPRMTRSERRNLRSAIRVAVASKLRSALPFREPVESVADFYGKRKRLFLKIDANGANGANGAKSENGANGVKSENGANGANGANSENGANGVKSENGAKGKSDGIGAKSKSGTNGASGKNGTKSENGAKGKFEGNGAKSESGAKGKFEGNGAKSESGAKEKFEGNGAKSESGANGANGLNGASGKYGTKSQNSANAILWPVNKNVCARRETWPISGKIGAKSENGTRGRLDRNGANSKNGAKGNENENSAKGRLDGNGAKGRLDGNGANSAKNAKGNENENGAIENENENGVKENENENGTETEFALKYEANKPFSGFWTRAGIARDWPKYVEIFANEDGSRRIWVNDTDHVVVECACGGRRVGDVRGRGRSRNRESQGEEEEEEVVGGEKRLSMFVPVGKSESNFCRHNEEDDEPNNANYTTAFLKTTIKTLTKTASKNASNAASKTFTKNAIKAASKNASSAASNAASKTLTKNAIKAASKKASNASSETDNRIQVTREDAVRTWQEHTIMMRKLEMGLAENQMEWSACEGGFLTTSPADVGAATRVVVWMHLPNLSQRPEFTDILRRLNLRGVGACGVDSRPILSVYRIENSLTFGLTEDAVISIVVTGITTLAMAEEELAGGTDFFSLSICPSNPDSNPNPTSAIKSATKQNLLTKFRKFLEEKTEIQTKHIKPEYPDLKSWSTLTSRILTKELYGKLTRPEDDRGGSGGGGGGGGVGGLGGGVVGGSDVGGSGGQHRCGALSGFCLFDHVIRFACDNDYVDAIGGNVVDRPETGCVALNADSYRQFGRFFERIVGAGRSVVDQHNPPFHRSEKRRKIFEDVIQAMDMNAEFLAEEGRERLKTVRIRILRNIRGFDFSPAITRRSRRKLWRLLRDILLSSDGRLGMFRGQLRDVSEALEEIQLHPPETFQPIKPGQRQVRQQRLNPRQRKLLLSAFGHRTTTLMPHYFDAHGGRRRNTTRLARLSRRLDIAQRGRRLHRPQRRGASHAARRRRILETLHPQSRIFLRGRGKGAAIERDGVRLGRGVWVFASVAGALRKWSARCRGAEYPSSGNTGGKTGD